MTTPSWRRLVRISVADADATDSSSDDEPDILRGPPSKPKKFVRQAIVGSTQAAADHGPKKKYKGVRQRPWGKWHAELRLGSRRFHLGSFTTAYDAAVAYDLASLRLHGPNAFTNLPLGSDGTVGASTHLENDSHLERLPKRPRECGNISASPEPLKDVNSSCEKCRAVSVAPDALEIATSVAQDRVGPDYFRYYACAVADLLSQKEDILPCCNASRLYQGQVTCFTEKTIGGSCDGSDLFAGSSMGAWLSDFRKERLKLLLRESVRDLATEVDEVLNPVLALHQLRCRLRSKFGASSSITTGSCPKVNDDLQFLLKNDSILVEEAVDKYSNELSKKLVHMERRLSKVLDTVMSTCRQMTCSEKQHLVKLIQRLPDEGLVRVAEIIQRNMPAEKLGCDEIFIDLEQQDNVTLWRLYYYVEAVRKAKMLAAEYGTQSQHHQSWNYEAIYQESNTSWR